MSPFSYTGLKIVHEQMIQEALERRRFSARQEMQNHGLHQTFGTFLPRFSNLSARKPEATPPFCEREVECSVS